MILNSDVNDLTNALYKVGTVAITTSREVLQVGYLKISSGYKSSELALLREVEGLREADCDHCKALRAVMECINSHESNFLHSVLYIE